MEEICYRYDGSFAGFLSCVFDSYACARVPADYLTWTDEACSLWPEQAVETSRPRAARVYRALAQRLSPAFQRIVEKGFLTCLPQREMALHELIRRGFAEGDRVRLCLTEPTLARILLAIRKLDTEVDHLKGFIRFSDLEGVLVGEIEPKNRVLPLLGGHFAARLPGERLALYDRTHRQALLCAQRRRRIVPVEDFRPGAADEAEERFRALWRRFFQVIAVEGRENPRCQATHLPKRYRGVMTEFDGGADGFPKSPAHIDPPGPEC